MAEFVPDHTLEFGFVEQMDDRTIEIDLIPEAQAGKELRARSLGVQLLFPDQVDRSGIPGKARSAEDALSQSHQRVPGVDAEMHIGAQFIEALPLHEDQGQEAAKEKNQRGNTKQPYLDGLNPHSGDSDPDQEKGGGERLENQDQPGRALDILEPALQGFERIGGEIAHERAVCSDSGEQLEQAASEAPALGPARLVEDEARTRIAIHEALAGQHGLAHAVRDLDHLAID